MNSHAQVKVDATTPLLAKAAADSPAIVVADRETVLIKAATAFNGQKFLADTPVQIAAPSLVAGGDYVVVVDAQGARAEPVTAVGGGHNVLGGFHFAPGGNAKARSGGDTIPAINPWSLWDRTFRPACANPFGMFLNEVRAGLEWIDIYLLGKNHLADGTSRFGVTIADGDDPPQDPAGGYFDRLDYDVAQAVMKHHGKTLMSYESFISAAHGVTERTVHDGDPVTTKWDAPRVSQRGGNQMSGNLWQWGHDGDPDEPRASIFGGSCWGGGSAGSRCAGVDYWAGGSDEVIGARGRSDHLQLG